MAALRDLERSAIVEEAILVNAVDDDGWTHATDPVGDGQAVYEKHVGSIVYEGCDQITSFIARSWDNARKSEHASSLSCYGPLCRNLWVRDGPERATGPDRSNGREGRFDAQARSLGCCERMGGEQGLFTEHE